MKRSLLFLIALFVLCNFSVLAQKRTKSASSNKAKAAAAPPAPPDFTLETTQIKDNLKAITRFIYLYGKISNGMELAEEQSRKTRLPASVIEKNTDNKNGVIRGINGLKDQVDKLGTVLQANPKLQVQYINLAGVTQKITEAAALVGSNQFDEAGRSLLTAAERLTEILSQTK